MGRTPTIIISPPISLPVSLPINHLVRLLVILGKSNIHILLLLQETAMKDLIMSLVGTTNSISIILVLENISQPGTHLKTILLLLTIGLMADMTISKITEGRGAGPIPREGTTTAGSPTLTTADTERQTQIAGGRI